MNDSNLVLQILTKVCNKLILNYEQLNELDRLIGDGDHGTNIKRGSEEILKTLPNWEGKTTKEILNNSAMILMSKVGGSSGPILATMLMQMAKENNLADALVKAGEGIQARGKAKVGEKTLVDILVPFAQTYQEKVLANIDHKTAMELALKVAKEYLDNSKNIPATKGRASYLGNRSIGITDAGSQTMYYILETIYEETK
ncbi:dihydroxyacetone kinase subunit DhaL [Mycoplasma corogypsi]|uniref:dihydroxyacetone kinase subunit DhaL n=1 Tax=Mycoplasma corogypsi TaxID=2106 RepID=UPI00387359F0